MRELEHQKRDTKGTIVHMHDKIKMMNSRLQSQTELQKYKEDQQREKIEMLEKRIELLNNQISKDAERKKGVKPLPF